MVTPTVPRMMICISTGTVPCFMIYIVISAPTKTRLAPTFNCNVFSFHVSASIELPVHMILPSLPNSPLHSAINLISSAISAFRLTYSVRFKIRIIFESPVRKVLFLHVGSWWTITAARDITLAIMTGLPPSIDLCRLWQGLTRSEAARTTFTSDHIVAHFKSTNETRLARMSVCEEVSPQKSTGDVQVEEEAVSLGEDFLCLETKLRVLRSTWTISRAWPYLLFYSSGGQPEP